MLPARRRESAGPAPLDKIMMPRRFMQVVLTLAVAGCSGSQHPVRQRGIVTLEGQPLAEFTVTLLAADNKRPATATTDEEGRFELMTINPGDGALPGKYKVVVTGPPVAQPVPGAPPFKAESKKKAPAIHANYTSAQTTPLECVVPAPAGEIRLDLKRNGS